MIVIRDGKFMQPKDGWAKDGRKFIVDEKAIPATACAPGTGHYSSTLRTLRGNSSASTRSSPLASPTRSDSKVLLCMMYDP